MGELLLLWGSGHFNMQLTADTGTSIVVMSLQWKQTFLGCDTSNLQRAAQNSVSDHKYRPFVSTITSKLHFWLRASHLIVAKGPRLSAGLRWNLGGHLVSKEWPNTSELCMTTKENAKKNLSRLLPLRGEARPCLICKSTGGSNEKGRWTECRFVMQS